MKSFVGQGETIVCLLHPTPSVAHIAKFFGHLLFSLLHNFDKFFGPMFIFHGEERVAGPLNCLKIFIAKN